VGIPLNVLGMMFCLLVINLPETLSGSRRATTETKTVVKVALRFLLEL
jgi:hypothetical protein